MLCHLAFSSEAQAIWHLSTKQHSARVRRNLQSEPSAWVFRFEGRGPACAPLLSCVASASAQACACHRVHADVSCHHAELSCHHKHPADERPRRVKPQALAPPAIAVGQTV